jgi:hypothetical protein
LKAQLVSVGEEAELNIPPPSFVAEFAMNVQLLIVGLPEEQ